MTGGVKWSLDHTVIWPRSAHFGWGQGCPECSARVGREMPGYWLKTPVHRTPSRKQAQCRAEISLDELTQFICDLEEGHPGPHIGWDLTGSDEGEATVGYSVIWPISKAPEDG